MNRVKTGKVAPHAVDGTVEVDAFMAKLEHPLKSQIEAVRQTIRRASPAVSEAIKWNAPSFRTTEFFATIHLRAREQVQVVFHRGVKVRGDAPKIALPDPKGRVRWLTPDRCLVTVGADAADLTALTAIVRVWIKFV